MLIEPQTEQKILPNSGLNSSVSHYFLKLDTQGTGLHHANLQPDDFGEHEHPAHQITVLFNHIHALSTWHSASGRRMHSPVRTGQCYVVPSQQPHGLTIDRAGEMVSFFLAPGLITETLPESEEGRSLLLGDLHISDDPLIQQLAATVRRDRLLHGVANKLLVESATNVLAFHLVNHYATVAVKVTNSGALSTYHLAKVKDFIEAEGTGEITIADIAKVTGYSSVHFSRMFKQATGQTPRQYLIHYRIERAKRLLQTTEMPIVDIAYQVGFSSHAHFSTQFRQVTGITPQMYRQPWRLN